MKHCKLYYIQFPYALKLCIRLCFKKHWFNKEYIFVTDIVVQVIYCEFVYILGGMHLLKNNIYNVFVNKYVIANKVKRNSV